MKVQVEEESLRFQSASGRGEEDSSVLNSLREDAEQARVDGVLRHVDQAERVAVHAADGEERVGRL